MEQQIVELNFDPMENLDFTLLTNSIQSSLPTEEISKSITGMVTFSDNIFHDLGTRVRYDYNTLESFYEIDVADLNMTLYPDQLFKELLNDFQGIKEFPVSTVDEINELLKEGTEAYHPTESNDMADRIQSTDEQLAMIKPNDSSLPVIRPHIAKLSTKGVYGQSILLSESVAVTVPTPNQLQLAFPLEDTYRARYKSDYFPQSGAVRRPRYVADNAGSHYISLQMPTAYSRDCTHKYIRVALITTSINNRGHFYSPYKFQTNHDDVKVPDQNPIYVSVETNQANNFTMKLHLVLIKSKLDQLNHAQPLKPFLDTVNNIQNIINEEKLTPKELINKYQLDKSHIAFTLCTKLSDGSYQCHPETTIISSVISEASTKPSTTSNNKSDTVTATTSVSNKKIRCPHCSHSFDLSNADITEGVSKRKSNDSTSCATSKSPTNNRVNKKKKKAS